MKDIDIFVCTETWLNERHGDGLMAIPGYSCFREDRQDRIGGGVAIWVRDCVPAQRLALSSPSQVESLMLRIVSSNLIVLALYIPPNSATRDSDAINAFLQDSLDNALSSSPESDIVLCGDLNRFSVSDVCSSFTLINKFNKPTYGDAQLDYILISEDLCDEYDVSDCCPFDKSKVPHASLLATPRRKTKKVHAVCREVYDLRRSNLEHFVDVVRLIDWSFIDDTQLSLDSKCYLFHTKLYNAVNEAIPVSYVRCSPMDKPWITLTVKELINKRWAAYRARNFPLYNHLKSKVQTEIKKCKVMWTKKLQGTSLWKAVHAHQGVKSGNPLNALLSEFTSLKDGVEAINAMFASIFLPESSATIDLETYASRESWNISVTPKMVFDSIRGVPKSKSSPDMPTILYQCANVFLADPLSRLFNLSINSRIMPKVWKTAFICPIPKSTPAKLNALRPISLLCLPGKLLERFVLTSVKETILKNYDDSQFGFRPRSSCSAAIISLHDHLTEFLDDPTTCGAMIATYDYSKAFDRLRTDIIINRLVQCRLPMGFVQWILSYLTDRYQQVKIGLTKSELTRVTSGVPQGSILGPYLYAVATATLRKVNDCVHLVKYADDTTLCFPIFLNSSNAHILQEHQHILNWSKSMSLDINDSKCQNVVIRKRNFQLPFDILKLYRVSSLRVLGVWFNEAGNWSTHMDMVSKIASRRLFALRLLKPTISKENLKVVYFALVRSVLEYCAPAFVSATNSDLTRLEKIQSRFHKILCTPDCRDACLPDLRARRDELSLRLLSSIMSGNHILRSLLPQKSLTGRFILPHHFSSRRGNTYFLYVCQLFNLVIFKR